MEGRRSRGAGEQGGRGAEGWRGGGAEGRRGRGAEGRRFGFAHRPRSGGAGERRSRGAEGRRDGETGFLNKDFDSDAKIVAETRFLFLGQSLHLSNIGMNQNKKETPLVASLGAIIVVIIRMKYRVFLDSRLRGNDRFFVLHNSAKCY